MSVCVRTCVYGCVLCVCVCVRVCECVCCVCVCVRACVRVCVLYVCVHVCECLCVSQSLVHICCTDYMRMACRCICMYMDSEVNVPPWFLSSCISKIL